MRVGLLVPTSSGEGKVLAVPELHAHAMGLPGLRYVTDEATPGIVIGRSAMVPVNLPRPERLAWHKMLVSQVRHDTSEKASKDIEQAATLIAILAEAAPESVIHAFRDVPRKARDKTKQGARRVLARLKATKHAAAASLLEEILR